MYEEVLKAVCCCIFAVSSSSQLQYCCY